MKILAHRGIWNSLDNRNSKAAINFAFKNMCGIETDVRDFGGDLVICHDIPLEKAYTFDELLNDYVLSDSGVMLALNIKSDGLAESVLKKLDNYNVKDYFCFDMSIPDMKIYLDYGLNTAARVSEYEDIGKMSELTNCLWLDGFHSDEPILRTVNHWERWLSDSKKVCIVSPELHGREHLHFWKYLLTLPCEIIGSENIFLCTDFPLEARRLFSE